LRSKGGRAEVILENNGGHLLFPVILCDLIDRLYMDLDNATGAAGA
jgi:hypothetical protein